LTEPDALSGMVAIVTGAASGIGLGIAQRLVVGLTKSLALEFGPQGITVNTIPRGFIDTPMTRDAEANCHLGNSIDFHATLTPVRRLGRPEDIAACAFLCPTRRATSPDRSSA
jgi:NAD(P)-dependent dehydrogenase (short-subunit alcohol dehydrogenase family)